MKKNKRFAMTGAITITVMIVTLIVFSHLAYSGIRILGISSVASTSNRNESNPQYLSAFLNPDNNTIGGPIAYFPFSLPGSNITMALIPRGSHITLANSNVSSPLAFGADFGIALLTGSASLGNQIGFAINSVKIEENNASFQGKILNINEVSSGTTAFVNTWEYGPAYRVMTIFCNNSKGYLAYLEPGQYVLKVNISLYSIHLFYRSFIGNLDMSMPWAIVEKNFTGASYGYSLNPNI